MSLALLMSAAAHAQTTQLNVTVVMRTEQAIDHSELAGAVPVALLEPLPRLWLVEILDY
jgi:hypothetical protein